MTSLPPFAVLPKPPTVNAQQFELLCIEIRRVTELLAGLGLKGILAAPVEPRPVTLKRWKLLVCAALGALLFSSCGQHINFKKVDLHGHVRVTGPDSGEGYCFHVPSEWEIREDLEGADVVCLSPPVKGEFRESVVARTLSAADLKDPQALIDSELGKDGEQATVVEPWDGTGQKPMLVNVTATRFSEPPIAQLLFFHPQPDGGGVMICCTTTQQDMPARRADFEAIVAKAKFNLEECPGPAGVPETFPTPEVTYSPGAPVGAAPAATATP